MILLSVTLGCVAAGTAIGLWLDRRQYRAVRDTLDRVPPDFAGRLSPDDHRRAGEQAMERLRFGAFRSLCEAALLAAGLCGGLGVLSGLAERIAVPGLARGLVLFGLVWLASSAVALPLRAWSVLVIEQRHGFNRQTVRGFVRDTVLGTLVTAAVGAPLLSVLLLLFGLPPLGGVLPGWVVAWAVLSAVMIAGPVVYLRLVAPLFNRFKPLREEIAAPVSRLLRRHGFRAAGLFEMDASRRSSRGNAFFSGFGAAKRIVLFDTLLDAHPPEEIEAVVAHELGHSVHRHVLFGVLRGVLLVFGLCAAIGWLAPQPFLLVGFGLADHPEPALRLILAMVLAQCAMPPFMLLFNAVSRRNEFQADAFAAAEVGAGPMEAALFRLSRDNRATLVRDRLYSLLHDTHPPVIERIARLRTVPRAVPRAEWAEAGPAGVAHV